MGITALGLGFSIWKIMEKKLRDYDSITKGSATTRPSMGFSAVST